MFCHSFQWMRFSFKKVLEHRTVIGSYLSQNQVINWHGGFGRLEIKGNMCCKVRMWVGWGHFSNPTTPVLIALAKSSSSGDGQRQGRGGAISWVWKWMVIIFTFQLVWHSSRRWSQLMSTCQRCLAPMSPCLGGSSREGKWMVYRECSHCHYLFLL